MLHRNSKVTIILRKRNAKETIIVRRREYTVVRFVVMFPYNMYNHFFFLWWPGFEPQPYIYSLRPLLDD